MTEEMRYQSAALTQADHLEWKLMRKVKDKSLDIAREEGVFLVTPEHINEAFWATIKTLKEIT